MPTNFINIIRPPRYSVSIRAMVIKLELSGFHFSNIRVVYADDHSFQEGPRDQISNGRRS